MKRIIDNYLRQWSAGKRRKPLLLRGARQVGKTYSVRSLGKQFENFVEINFELRPEASALFELNLDPYRISRDLSILLSQPIEPGKTLLFFDEIQAAPKAFLSLRYFYEMMPELHLIAAGSLLDFTVQELGMPVGRIVSLYMYPVSFLEFLVAVGEHLLAREIVHHTIETPLSEVIHEKALRLVGTYLAVGGMPEAVACWQQKNDLRACFDIHTAIVDAYKQDFHKYAQKFQIKYVSTLFAQIPRQLGRKFKYSDIEGEYRKRELAPALDLLVTAGVIHKVLRTAGNGIPLGAEVEFDDFKLIFLDVALAQKILGINVGGWILDPLQEFINKGELVEAFVGQELLTYSYPMSNSQLYYWQRQERSSQAEIDYLVQLHEHIIPVEVKSGAGTALRSMNLFLERHEKVPYGIRFSTLNYSEFNKLHSYPLYAVSHIMKDNVLLEEFLG
jgi:uncharacterized protein